MRELWRQNEKQHDGHGTAGAARQKLGLKMEKCDEGSFIFIYGSSSNTSSSCQNN